jgi:hypothetical protein
LTDHPDGATRPICAPTGDQIAYLEEHPSREKLPPVTLRTTDLSGRDSKTVLEKTQLLQHSWSPKGDRLAVSLVQELRILEMPSGKTVKTFKLGDISKELYAHAAHGVLWRPDGGALACSIGFLGGRMEGAVDFGDDKLFIFPMNGKPAIVEAGGSVFLWRWTR